MTTGNITTILLQNLDENVNIELQYTKNDSQKKGLKSLKDYPVLFAIKEIENH